MVGQDGGTQRLGGQLEEKGAHADGVIDEEENEDGEPQPGVERPEVGLICFLVVFEDRLQEGERGVGGEGGREGGGASDLSVEESVFLSKFSLPCTSSVPLFPSAPPIPTTHPQANTGEDYSQGL